jgi:hypothetical protein
MTDPLYLTLLAGLAVWRLTHLFSMEDGPWNCFAVLRERAARVLSPTLVSCFYCLSLWVSAPFALWLGSRWEESVLLWLSLSAGAILLERATDRQPSIWSTPYFEHEEVNAKKGTYDNVLLRQK